MVFRGIVLIFFTFFPPTLILFSFHSVKNWFTSEWRPQALEFVFWWLPQKQRLWYPEETFQTVNSNVTMERLFRKNSPKVFILTVCYSPVWCTTPSWFYGSLLHHVWIKQTGVLWLRKFIPATKIKFEKIVIQKRKGVAREKYKEKYSCLMYWFSRFVLSQWTHHIHQMQWQLLRSWMKFELGLNRVVFRACSFLSILMS